MPRRERDRDGNFRATPRTGRVRLDPMVGTDFKLGQRLEVSAGEDLCDSGFGGDPASAGVLALADDDGIFHLEPTQENRAHEEGSVLTY